MLTNLANQYQAASAGWMTVALVYALHLFYLLVAIELAVFALYNLLQKDGLADFFAALLIKLLAVLFFWVMLQEAPIWIPTIIQSFTQAGVAIGNTTTLDPSSVFNQGIMVANTALQGINNASIFNALLLIVVAGLAALVIVIAYTVIAAQLLITLVESYIVIGGGVLMIGFAGSRWTLVFTERYFGYMVSVGIKLFVLYLLIGLGGTLAPQYATAFTTATANILPDPMTYLEVMGGSMVFMILSWQVPSLAAAMMTGSPSLTLGTATTTAAMLTAITTAAVAKGMQQSATTATRMGTATQAAASLSDAAKTGFSGYRQSGAGIPTAAARTLGDISRAASQQLRESRNRTAGQSRPRDISRAASQHFPHDQAHGNVTIRFNQSE